MARFGKIARCPHHIREELNRRIDNNESGARLVAWLNTLPEVKQVLDSDFEGREISEQNLTEWKDHGYRRWQAQQHAMITTREVNANVSELSAQSGGAINESLATILATRFADALLASGGEITDEMRDQLRNEVKILRSISREVARLGRYQHDRDRVHIQRERLDLSRERLQLQQSKIKNPNSKMQISPSSDPQMTEEEKARTLKEFIYPKRLFPEKYAPGPGIESAAASQPMTVKETLAPPTRNDADGKHADPNLQEPQRGSGIQPRVAEGCGALPWEAVPQIASYPERVALGQSKCSMHAEAGRESAPSEATDNGQRTTDKPGNQTITS